MEKRFFWSRPAAPREQSSSKKTLLQRIWDARVLYLLLTPTIIGMVIFQYYPAFTAFFRSFYSWDGRRATYVGVFNYEYFLEDPRLLQAWANVIQFLAFNLFTVLTVPLLVAYLIYRLPNDNHRYLYRVAVVFPLIVPGFVFIVLWRWILSLNGALNIILRGIGLEAITRTWLGDTSTALYALMFMGFPWVDVIAMLIYLAGLMGIPGEIVDAAVVDGASGFNRFWRIELPLIQGQLKVMIILTFIGTIQDFSRSYFMTKGGPGWTTMVPGLRMYLALSEEFDYGYASAIGVALFIVIFALTLINQRLIKGSEPTARD